MLNPLRSTGVLSHLSRPALLGLVALFAFGTVACSDDDDPAGVSADCLDAIEDFLDEIDVDEDEVQSISVGQSRNATLSNSDIEVEGTIADLYVLDLPEDMDIQVTANPETGYDIALALGDSDGFLIDNSDDPEDADATEVVAADLVEACYLIIVGNIEGETGSYTIEVEED